MILKPMLIILSKSSISTTSSKTPSSLSDAISIGGSSKNNAKYSLKLPTNASEGITTYDNTSNISFTMIPLFSTYAGKQVSGHTVYPIGINGPKAVYTVKANGVQEDVVYAQAPKGNIKLQYKLKLPSTLQARMMPGNNIGIYSASPYLFGNITYGSSADQQKVQLAREKSAKNNLVFVLPAPKVITASGLLPTNNDQQVSLSLKGNIVTVTAKGLGNINGPISIDPSIVVTSASDFMNGGNNEGDITYDSTNNEITEAGLSGGTIGSWTATTSFPASGPTMPAREGAGVVAYNGNLYVMGGVVGSNSGDCTAAIGATGDYACKGVFYASINSGGTIGSWTATTSFPTSGPTMPARHGFGVVVYNGNLYVMGGVAAASGGDCTTGSVSTYYCNGVFYAPINANGTIGSWQSTTSFSTSSPTMPARGDVPAPPGPSINLGAVVYNGYLYLMGGVTYSSGGDCTTGSGSTYYCNGVFYAPINANGTIGSWQSTTSFSTSSPTMPARDGFVAMVYNGYLYVMGGVAAASGGDCTTGSGSTYYCNGVFYAPINANGTIGSWQSTTSFSTSSPTMPARGYFGAVVSNGYIYLMGGVTSASSGDCTVSTGQGYVCNGVFYAPINANGTIGSWSATTTFSSSSPTMPARFGESSVAYNGYIYVLGGDAATTTNSGDCAYGLDSQCNGVFSAPINSAGTIGTNWTATTTFTTTSMPARLSFGAVAYNGNLYVVGGYADNSTSGDCASNVCNGVFYAPINANGTIGSWTATTTFPSSSPTMPARYGLGTVAYNGYLYVMGGEAAASSGDCTVSDTGTNTYFCNGTFFAPINASGTIGSWAATTTFPSGMPARADAGGNQPHSSLAPVAYNGYLYLMGGMSPASSGDCTTGSGTTYFCNGTFYTPINTNGTIGSWTATTTFPSSNPTMPARDGFASVVYDGYLYVMGGLGPASTGDCNSASYCNGVFYAPINANGTIGSWTATTTFPSSNPTMPARIYMDAVAYNGYLYITGGASGSSSGDCTASLNSFYYCNGVFYAPINANGTIGSWTATTSYTSTTMPARAGAEAVAYGGYLYVMGGASNSSGGGDCGGGGTPYSCNGVFYSPINNGGPGTISSWTQVSGATFPSGMPAREGFNSVAYNGYLYVMGGVASASSGDCTATGNYCNGVSTIRLAIMAPGSSWTADTSLLREHLQMHVVLWVLLSITVTYILLEEFKAHLLKALLHIALQDQVHGLHLRA